MYASPVPDAYQNAPEQLAGVLANFKMMLDKLLDPAMFWVLSGDDTPAVVNDPKAPTVVCLGNTPTKKENLSPVLAMLISFLSTNLYGHGRAKSFVMLDELPTLFLPNLSEVPATARKYGVSTIVALQNMAQLEKRYTAVGATELRETFSNHLIGRGPYKVAKDWSERIGRKDIKSGSHTTSKNRDGKTVREKEKLILTPQEAMDLGVGEFP
ncbi:TraM recognition domain-containing protein, partial [Candidatus Bathyarchaeota archaeon]|nr:TraM recognition domain-containing protein [Candidatus Bathyarchaeota archaeon]NIV68491.1 TraM recognition domain-containing protein [Candidatus Bathyarchaeota archaeon]NIW35002.1 TraM recognition domain-containing protein [Candidatus Bathyarchaeota archaeon]